MARRKVITTVYLTEDQHRRLKALSDKTAVPAATYVRRGVDRILEEEERRQKIIEEML